MIMTQRIIKIVVLLVSLGYSLWALPNTAQGQTDIGQLIVYANGPYEVWAGSYRSIGPDYWIYYYNIDLQEAYVKLGEGTGTQSFPSGYRYYVIATRSLFQLDAIQLPNGEYISGVNYEEGEYVDWGNVHLPFEFNDPPSSPCDIIGDIIDYRHDDYIYGPPDGLTDDVGHPPGCEGTLQNYEGFVVVESYIDTNEDRLDIEQIGITSFKIFLDGTPSSSTPWRPEFWAYVVDPGTLDHINITKPDDLSPFDTMYQDEEDPSRWDASQDDIPYRSLEDLRKDYPDGIYIFDFCEENGTVLRTVSLDYSGLSEPVNPIDYVYPPTYGATGIPTNPTITWTVNSTDGDALMMELGESTGTAFYRFGPASITTTSWTPGSLLTGREYELDVSVINIKDLQTGPTFPTMTVDGDEFQYALIIEYLNDITFTTALPSADPIDEIEEVLDFVDESMDAGTLTGDGPGNSGDNRLNALINMLEEAQRLIEAGQLEDACDQLWSAYRKCDGEARPPDFVTGEAAEDLAVMILGVMFEIGCD